MIDKEKIAKALSGSCPKDFGRFVKKKVDTLVASKLTSLGFMSYDTFRAQRNFLDDIEKRICLLEEKLDRVEKSVNERESK
ncbi:conserved hypothetical protein [Candidatus Ichthyocystis hellenicum]|uniref:Ubiquinone biosynthesis accessory factor UbiK n=2 Tax=Burkholderiales genera incertae sedis TaxID=224471 RepID=A0A0S4M0J4_9BURK|nr:conserved hypothetical protein [Candidatus Ichthyocystis hellenicum]